MAELLAVSALRNCDVWRGFDDLYPVTVNVFNVFDMVQGRCGKGGNHTGLIGCLRPLLSDFVIYIMFVISGILASCISVMVGWLTSNPRIRYCPCFFTCQGACV